MRPFLPASMGQSCHCKIFSPIQWALILPWQRDSTQLRGQSLVGLGTFTKQEALSQHTAHPALHPGNRV
jgi:hypothetical protein